MKNKQSLSKQSSQRNEIKDSFAVARRQNAAAFCNQSPQQEIQSQKLRTIARDGERDRLQMNKKADTRDRALISPWIALSVLAIVIIFLIIFGKPMYEKILIYIPGYNLTQPGTDNIEILRYDITNNKVQYYDGTVFLDFPDLDKEIKIGTKKISQENARYYFADNYFYNSKSREEKIVSLKQEVWDEIYTAEDIEKFAEKSGKTPPAFDAYLFRVVKEPSYVPDEGWREDLFTFAYNPGQFHQRGDVNSLLVGKGFGSGDNKVYGEFALSISNEMKIRKIEYDLSALKLDFETLSKNSETYKALAEPMRLWRDSVLATPMQFRFNSDKDCILVKVEKISNGPNVYLVADLKKPVGTC